MDIVFWIFIVLAILILLPIAFIIWFGMVLVVKGVGIILKSLSGAFK